MDVDLDGAEGWWWLPGGDPQFGRVSLKAHEPWRLDVFGGTGDAELSTAAVLHGQLLEHYGPTRSLTLFDLVRTKESNSFGGSLREVRTESWVFQSVVRGCATIDGDERVERARAGLSNMIEWIRCPRPQVVWAAERSTSEVRRTDLGSADVAGATISLVLDHQGFERRSEAVLRQTAYYEIVPDQPLLPGTVMDEFVTPLRALQSFLTLGYVAAETTRLAFDGHKVGDKTVWAELFTHWQEPIRPPKAPLAHDMLATWPSLNMTPAVLLSNWFSSFETLERVISMLLLPDHATYLYADDHVLTAFLAVEEYHDHRIGGTSVSPEEHQLRVDAVVAAAPHEHRVWARETLAGKNQKGQRKKVAEVVERAGATGQAVLDAVPQFKNLAVAARQRVAHPGSGGGAEQLAVATGLRWVLRHCVLLDIGVEEHRAAELIRDCRRFEIDLQQMAIWTRGD